MNWSQVQVKRNSASLPSSIAATWDATTKAGNLLLAFVCYSGTATSSITPPSGWTQPGWTASNMPGTAMEIFYIDASAPRSGSESFSFGTGPGTAALFMAEYSGGGAPVDGGATSTGNSASPVTATYNFTLNPEILALAVFAHGNSSNFTAPTNGFTIRDQVAVGSNNFGWLDKIATAVGDQSTQVGAGTSGVYCTRIVGFTATPDPPIIYGASRMRDVNLRL
mgnify:CR=1 FL=1